MTRERSADTFSEIARRQREIAAENGPRRPCGECHLRPGETCDICGVTEHEPAAAATWSECGCPTDHDAHGVYRKLHVPGCLAHFGSPTEIDAYRHWLVSGAPDPLAIGRPERGR